MTRSLNIVSHANVYTEPLRRNVIADEIAFLEAELARGRRGSTP